MSRRSFLWIASWIALGLNACTTLRPPVPAGPDTAKACADWRWIGISRAGARCPEVPGWTVRPLFPQLAPVPEACYGKPEVPRPGVNQVIQDLNRFCVYEIASPVKSLKHVPFPPAVSKDLVRFDQDCAALSSSAVIETAGDDWQLQSEKFLAQAGVPNEPLKINNRLGVRLAFLDTQPDGEGVPGESGRSPHGYTLANLARQLVCTPGPDEHCAAQITTRLAMPIFDFDPKKSKDNQIDPVHGGFLGMQSDLAEAIRSEVDDWWNAKQQRHLVLNLSMAWDGELFGGLDEQQIAEMRAGTQAVYRALQYAAGFDVLVVAAAGNQKRAPCENYGPLLPGAWERGEPRSCNKPLMPEPIVYAVGGVRADGTPLLNARPGGMPPRVAYGEKAVVPTKDPEKPTAMLTGSSVATAVVSSIAAIVWDSVPDKDSHEIMDLLYQSGKALDVKADFGAAGANALFLTSPSMAHRISLCTALKAACNGAPDCPVQGSCLPRWTPEVHEPRGDKKKNGEEKPVLGTCQPWLYPQPEIPPCPNCATDPPTG